MTTYINADDGIVSGVAGLKYGADSSGALVLQTNGTTAITISASQVVTFAGAVSLGALTTSGNLTFTGTANRIIGDFSNATIANRLLFQNSVTNGSSTVQAIPNGTSATSGFLGFNNSDPTNAAFIQISTAAGVEARLTSGITGTGTYLPMTFYNNGSERMRIDTSGNVGIGTTTMYGKFNSIPKSSFDAEGTTWAEAALSTQSTFGGGLSMIDGSAGYLFHVQGSGGVLSIKQGTVGSIPVERMRIDGSGYVGIGTSSPGVPLDVVSNSGAEVLRLRGRASDNIGTVRFTSNDGATSYGAIQGRSTYVEFATSQNIPIIFTTNSAERMRIVEDGNILIGTTVNSTGAKVNIATDGSGVNRVLSFTNTQASGRTYQFLNGGGTAGTFQIYDDTASAGRFSIDSTGNVGIGTGAPAAKLEVVGNARVSTYYNFNGNASNPTDATASIYDQAFVGPTISGASMAFRTGTTPAECMRITSAGNVGIGTTSPGEKLTINGTASVNGLFTTSGGMYFSNTMYLTASGATTGNTIGMRMSENYGTLWNGGTGTIWHHQVINASSTVGFASAGTNFGNGNIYCTGTLTQSYSDIRLKTKVSAISNALEKVCSIDTFVYVENDLAKSFGYTNTKEQLGVSAQSVEAVFPEVVSLAAVDIKPDPETQMPISKSGEHYLTVDYTRLVPALIEAIKELNAKVEVLEAQLTSKL